MRLGQWGPPKYPPQNSTQTGKRTPPNKRRRRRRERERDSKRLTEATNGHFLTLREHSFSLQLQKNNTTNKTTIKIPLWVLQANEPFTSFLFKVNKMLRPTPWEGGRGGCGPGPNPAPKQEIFQGKVWGRGRER